MNNISTKNKKMKLNDVRAFKDNVNNISTKKGFTLIELMVVVSIIIILSGFLFPKISGYKSKVQRVEAIDTARQVYTAVMTSYIEKDDKLDTENINTSLKELIGGDISCTVIGDNIVSAEYTCGKEKYNLNINVDKSSYNLKVGNNEVFSMNENNEI